MAWTENGGPRRLRDEMLVQVVARGTTLRRRRRVATAAGAGVLVLLVALAVGALARPGGNGTSVATSGRGTATSGVEGTATSTTATSTTATTALPTLSAVPTTATVPVKSTTTLSPNTTTTVPRTTHPTVAPTTTTTLPSQPCNGDKLALSISFDRNPPTYRPGQTVNATLTVRYTGQEPCLDDGGTLQSLQVLDPAGKSTGRAVDGIGDAPDAYAVEPGATVSTSIMWDQQAAPCSSTPPCQEPPGAYTAVMSWTYDGGTPATATAPFQLVAAP